MERHQKLFLVKFFGILIAAYLLIAWRPVNDHVIVPFTAWLASSSGAILNSLGQGVHVLGTLITSPRFAVNIENGCNGVEAMLILVACVAAFPASGRARVTGVLLGAVFVQVLNYIRIVTLYLLGAYHPRVFQLFHTAVWQIAIILAAIGFFLVWSSRVAPARVADGA
jgi:exosortase H (IPTLxxWG-CTERM-specific)